MKETTSEGTTEEPAPRCASCDEAAAEVSYELPLCPACRDRLVWRPLPLSIRATFVLIVLILLFALSKFPPSLVAGVAFERGRRAEGAGNYAVAVAEYKKAVRQFPDSTRSLARLGISQYRAGFVEESLLTLGKLEGREASDSLIHQVNQIFTEIETGAEEKSQEKQ